jgi:hypothetical protein
MPRKLTAYERLESIRRRSDDLALLKEVYGALFPSDYLPETQLFEQWLRKYDRDLIAEGFEIVGNWFREKTEMIARLKSEGRGVPAGLQKDKVEVIKYIQGTLKKLADIEEPDTEFLNEDKLGDNA